MRLITSLNEKKNLHIMQTFSLKHFYYSTAQLECTGLCKLIQSELGTKKEICSGKYFLDDYKCKTLMLHEHIQAKRVWCQEWVPQETIYVQSVT